MKELSAPKLLERIDRMAPAAGGVSARDGVEPDPMTTAQVLVLAHDKPAVGDLLAERKAAMISYLEAQQQKDGRWLREGDDWHTSITSWCLLALSAHGARDEGCFQRGVAWLMRRQTSSGGFAQSDVILEPHSYSSCYGTAALYTAMDDSVQVQNGLRWLREAQGRDGGFGGDCSVREGHDPSLTAYVAHALDRLPEALTQDVIEGCTKFIVATQRPTGAWSAWFEDVDSIEGTAAALRVLLPQQGKYPKQIDSGFKFLDPAVRLDDTENWIVVSLSYLVLS